MAGIFENADVALRIVRESKDVVYDTETTGLDWKHNAPIGYVVGNREQVVYVPVRHGGGGNILGGKPMAAPDSKWDVHPFEQELAKAFAERNTRVGMGRTIGHHMKFDVHMSANAGIKLGRNLACTQNGEAMLDEYAKEYSLEKSAERRGVQAKKGTDMYEHISRTLGVPNNRSSMSEFWRMPGNDPMVIDYASGDGVSTIQLYDKQIQQMQMDEMDVVWELEHDLIWTLFRMERKGIRVDLAKLDELREETEREIKELSKDFTLGFNVKSPKQVKELMEAAGHTDWPTTDLGNPSFTEKFLKKSPEGRAIIAIRQLHHLINTFVNPLASKHVFEGRVHATLHQLKSDGTGTISGRFSCSDPNLQGVVKRLKVLAKKFRQLFVADLGYIFWERDYSQCEPRLFAHYSQCKALIDGYNATPPMDAHAVVAQLLDVERDPTAKRMNMGIFTGMQVRSFADHMGWPVDKAGAAWHAWFKKFPEVRDFQNKAKARLQSRGYVYTLLGRRCRLEAPRFAYRGTSKIIQGSNADILKVKLLEADRMCEDNNDIVQILMTVHDSFNGQYEDTPEAKALFDDMVAAMTEVQCEPFNLSVPFAMDGYEGPNWSVATFGE